MPLQSVLHPFFLSALFVSQFDTLEIQLNGKLGSNTDGDSEGIAYAHLFWSIPGGSSSCCFCCDSLLHQRLLVRSARALSKFAQYLFLLFSFFFSYSFLLFGPPILSIPPSATAFYLAAVMARAVRVLLPVAAAFVAAHWSGFFFYFSLLISPWDWEGGGGVDDASGDDGARYCTRAQHR